MYGYGYKYTNGLVVSAGGAPFANDYSLAFDGMDDRVELTSDFVAAGEFTISFWMKPTSVSLNGTKYVIGYWSGLGLGNSIHLEQLSRIRIGIDGVLFSFREDLYGSNNIILNTWQNITITRDSLNGCRCFRNGLDFGYSGTPIVNSNTLTLNSIGRAHSNTFGFSGGLDEIAFWNSDETSNVTEIGGGTPTDLTDLNPYGWWRFEEGMGTSAIDNGSGGNNGTLVNSPAYQTDVP